MRGRLSRIAAAAAAAAGIIVAAGPAGHALAVTPAAGAFTMAPAPAADGQARGYFELSATAGGSVTDLVLLSNSSGTTERLRTGVTDGTTAANSGSAYDTLAAACAGPACWVAGVPRLVTLPPHSQEQVTFQVKVPAGTKPGQYLAGITATPEAAAQPTTVKAGGHAATEVIVVPRMVVGVAVTVGKLARLRPRAQITGMTAGWVDGLVRLTAEVRNTGERFTQGTGSTSCSMDGATHSFGLSMDTVLPGQGAGLPVNGTGMRAGTWRCTARISYTGGQTTAWTGNVVVPSTVAAATRPIANGDYVAPSGGGIPGWAIALMVLGGLLLFTLWAMFLRRERGRRLSG